MKLVNLSTTLVLLSLLLFACNAPAPEQNTEQPSAEISQTEIRETEEGYRLFVNGEPFYIKGAGLEFGDIPSLAKHGANAFRTWRTDNGQRSGKEVLDEAHEYGLKVAMGIDVGRERLGFDYDDKAAVAAQLARIKGEVMALKDHPALIIWGIGNELNHHSENPKVWDAVNEISQMIHEIDPNHITTTSLAGMNKEYVDLVLERAPDLDVLSVQMYAEIEILPQRIEESGYEGPLLVTEWGATGYWEVGTTEWGAPLENNSSVKADFYLSRYNKAIKSQSEQIIGSFVFLWGQKQERTPTWFGMFMPDGSETESIDAMHYAWNDEWPANRTPRLNDFSLEGQRAPDNIKLQAGQSYGAIADVTDPDSDELAYVWTIMRESTTNATGGDAEEVPEAIAGLFSPDAATEATFTAPTEPGAYRLFLEVRDGNRHSAHANIPFLVE
ncbi:MAG: glycoside hydrolase family 2 TIM barrel-domain containing protein [Bacteroidota bacterium]